MSIEAFEILNRRGKRMPATLRSSEGETNGVALVLHGLGGWKDQPIVVASAEALARGGYATLTFDAADGACAPDADFFNQTTTSYLDDVEDVLTYARTQTWWHESLAVAGHSMGGLVALTYASWHPEAVVRLILLAPAVSWRTMWWVQLRRLVPWLIVGRARWNGPNETHPYLGRRWLLDYFRYDGYTAARNATMPTLIVSAAGDRVVASPVEHASLARQFARAEHITIERASHTFSKQAPEVAATITAWLTSF